jgi:hypothetical protein
MKTSIFDMNFTLPPMVEMVQVEKDMGNGPFFFTASWVAPGLCYGR